MQGERALSRLEHGHNGADSRATRTARGRSRCRSSGRGAAGRRRPGHGQPHAGGRDARSRTDAEDAAAREGRVLQGLPRFALREGARHLDAGARADARPRAGGARVGDVLRRRRHPRGGAGLLPAPERAHPRVRGGDRRGHADDDLQRLHAQPAAGELAAEGRRCAARAREREPLRGRRAAVFRQRST